MATATVHASRFRTAFRSNRPDMTTVRAPRIQCMALIQHKSAPVSVERRPWTASLPALAAALLITACPGSASARDKVGEFAASGFLFKDTVEVNSIQDPAVPGVTLYISDFKRSLVDKLQKDFFTEPSQSSLTCAATGPIEAVNLADLGGSEGKEVFSEKKNLSLFNDKTLRVRRLYDSDHNTLVYVAYSTRLSTNSDGAGNVSSGRYRTSICALPVVSAPSASANQAAAMLAPANAALN